MFLLGGLCLYRLHQLRYVEDERHAAVPENGRAGDPLGVLVGATQALDHRLVLSDHLVHHEADPHPVHLGDDNLLDVGVRSRYQEALPKRDVGNQPLAYVG